MEAAQTLKPVYPEKTPEVSEPELPRPQDLIYPDYRLPDYSGVSGDPVIAYGTGQKHGDFGETYIDRVSMNDEQDTEYNVMRCLSNNPVSDIWIVKDTAWGTQVTGLNTDVARKLMKLGFNVLVKGPEKNSSIPLSQSAYNTHSVLDAYQKIGDLPDEDIAIEGYSRGSMIGLGTNAYAPKFNRNVLYSNFTDPCLALPVKVLPLDKPTSEKAVTLPLDLGMFGLAVAKGLLDKKRGRHIAKTIDPTLAGAQQFYRTGKPLMTGEAGMMAEQTPLDMKATIAFFRRCHVNDFSIYRSMLENRPGVRFVEPEGGHGGGLDKRIIGNIAVRFGRLAEELQTGKPHNEIDNRYITHGLHAA